MSVTGALVDVAGALTSHSELGDLLHSLRGHLEPIVPFTFLVVCLWDRESDRSRSVSRALRQSGNRVVGGSYPAQGTYPGMAVHTRRPIYVARVQPGGPAPRADRVRRPELLCRAALTAHDTIGTLNFGSQDADAYGAERHRADGRVAALVAVAVENAMSFETMHEQQAALSASATSSTCCSTSPTRSSRSSTRVSCSAPWRRRCGAAAARTSRRSRCTIRRHGVLRKHVCDAPPELRRRLAGPRVAVRSTVAVRSRVQDRRAAHLHRARARRRSRDRRLCGAGLPLRRARCRCEPRRACSARSTWRRSRPTRSPRIIPAADARRRPDRDRASATPSRTSGSKSSTRSSRSEKLYLEDEIRSEQPVRGDHRAQRGAAARAPGDRDRRAHGFDGADLRRDRARARSSWPAPSTS